MRIFKFWAEHSTKLNVGGTPQLSKVFGGSNYSLSDTILDAEKKFKKAQDKIDGDYSKDDDYESDIMEEVIHTIDDDNIVTRNRYGALILNSKKLLFIDIDSHTNSLSDFIFRRNFSPKELMLFYIEKTAQKKKYDRFGFRVYETAKGFRVLVTNKDFDPRSKESKGIMNDFNSDYLYRWLCIKQNCYRARLTPKPYRIKQKGIKVIYPNRNKEQELFLSKWIMEYDQKSKDFSTCHLVKEIGRTQMNDAIEYHDKLTSIKWSQKLA